MLSTKIWWQFRATRDPFPSLCCVVYRRFTTLESVSGSISFSLDAMVLSKPPAFGIKFAGSRE